MALHRLFLSLLCRNRILFVLTFIVLGCGCRRIFVVIRVIVIRRIIGGSSAGIVIEIILVGRGRRTVIFESSAVKCRIECVKVLIIKIVGDNAKSFAKALVMNDFPLAKELDRFPYVGVVGKTKDIVICGTCFLLGCQVFVDISDRISLYLKRCGAERNACGISRVYPGGVVDEICSKSAGFYFLHG